MQRNRRSESGIRRNGGTLENLAPKSRLLPTIRLRRATRRQQTPRSKPWLNRTHIGHTSSMGSIPPRKRLLSRSSPGSSVGIPVSKISHTRRIRGPPRHPSRSNTWCPPNPTSGRCRHGPSSSRPHRTNRPLRHHMHPHHPHELFHHIFPQLNYTRNLAYLLLVTSLTGMDGRGSGIDVELRGISVQIDGWCGLLWLGSGGVGECFVGRVCRKSKRRAAVWVWVSGRCRGWLMRSCGVRDAGCESLYGCNVRSLLDCSWFVRSFLAIFYYY
jgi:hypothetical protein